MGVEVGILYTDLTRVWVPIDQLDDVVRKDDVLTISVTAERGNRGALAGRLWSFQNNDQVAAKNLPWWGEDNYAIGVMPNGTYFTFQWSDDEEFLHVRSTADGSMAGTLQRPAMFPRQANVTVFRGGYIRPVNWASAMAVFEAEMF